MKTIEEMIVIMQAFSNGKIIEFECSNGKWLEEPNPSWDWKRNNYRIKPEEPKPEYIPYESAEEFLQGQKEHSKYVLLKQKLTERVSYIDSENHVCLVDCNRIATISDLDCLFVNYTWNDGSICGKLKQSL